VPLSASARRAANAINGSTLLGVLIARAGGARIGRGPDGLLMARGYARPLPSAPAFTVGDVVISRDPDVFRRRPRLLTHERRHAEQYARFLGPGFLLLYGAAAAWSQLSRGDPYSGNVFERRAGLSDGGYVERPPRRRRFRPGVGRGPGHGAG
jgi:hypothetical protein